MSSLCNRFNNALKSCNYTRVLITCLISKLQNLIIDLLLFIVAFLDIINGLSTDYDIFHCSKVFLSICFVHSNFCTYKISSNSFSHCRYISYIFTRNSFANTSFEFILYKRLARYLVSRGKTGCINGVTCSITPITTLRQFRDELAYIIRNPFVVRNDVHLFAYRWCSGYLYFNAFLSKTAGRTAAEISYRERRLVTRSSAEEIPADFRIEGTLILPESFVNYRLAEQLFESVRQFLHWTLKNVEAQVEVAHSHGEHPQLSDDELFIPSRDLCERLFGTRQPKELTYQQKKEYVMALRKAYGASNGQLARLGSLPLADVNTMYPLSAKG